jgi:hypothetical protein
LVGQLDFDDDFSHVRNVPDLSRRRKPGMKARTRPSHCPAHDTEAGAVAPSAVPPWRDHR